MNEIDDHLYTLYEIVFNFFDIHYNYSDNYVPFPRICIIMKIRDQIQLAVFLKIFQDKNNPNKQ